MDRVSYLRLLAQYNAWMNEKLYVAASKLSAAELALDRKVFFGSILGTLNHLIVGDTLWLKRFATHPTGYAALTLLETFHLSGRLDEICFSDFQELATHRRMLDGIITSWALTIVESDLDQSLRYANTKGKISQRNYFALVVHFFNHQTHHRGQVTTLLSQAGMDVGITDLLALMPDELS